MKPDHYTIGRAASLAEKWQFRELLLSADPSEEMIARYLAKGDMLVWRDADGGVIGEAVVDAAGEVKNLAVAPAMQGRGWGRRILDDLCEHYKGVFPALTVGTSGGVWRFMRNAAFGIPILCAASLRTTIRNRYSRRTAARVGIWLYWNGSYCLSKTLRHPSA